MTSLVSHNVEETMTIGEALGKLVRSGDFIALAGDLGAGKTHLAQGLARGLGVDTDVCVASPSYTLLNEYAGRFPLFHFDLYRLDGDADIRELGFYEYFSGRGVCVVEWADRLVAELPDEYLRIEIFLTGDTERRLELSWQGSRYQELTAELVRALSVKS